MDTLYGAKKYLISQLCHACRVCIQENMHPLDACRVYSQVRGQSILRAGYNYSYLFPLRSYATAKARRVTVAPTMVVQPLSLPSRFFLRCFFKNFLGGFDSRVTFQEYILGAVSRPDGNWSIFDRWIREIHMR